MVEDKPLVSVIVITYNSGNTVIQALDSIVKQTYWNIQLVISDDYSQDDTVKKCQEWICSNKDRFVDVKLIQASQNTGTPGNCNRGVKSSDGQWIKLIAGDDMLLPNCIEDCVDFVLDNHDCEILFGRYSSFDTKTGDITIRKSLPEEMGVRRMLECKNSTEQLYIYLESIINITPSLFYKKEIVELVGGFNERYKLFEDTPFVTEVLKSGRLLYFLDKNIVLYRIDTTSVTRDSSNKFFYKKAFVQCNFLFRKEKIYPLYKWYNLQFWINEYSFKLLYYFTVTILKNKRTGINKFIYYSVKAINPYYLYEFLKRKVYNDNN